MNRWEMYRRLNLLIRFPRITKNQKTLILSGPKNGGAYKKAQEMALLFRAEWDNKSESNFEHPQPHWHFHPQVDYSFGDVQIDSDSFKAYLELISHEGFEKELDHGNANRQVNDISSFHFAMAARWQDKKSAIIPLNETNLKNWLVLLLRSIDLQLNYCFN